MKELAAAAAAVRAAAEPSLDLCIAGEGNISVLTPEGRFFVTATGSRLADCVAEDFVEVNQQMILDGLQNSTDDDSWLQVLLDSRLDPAGPRPSVEVGMHAVLAEHHGPGMILHTHPTAVLAALTADLGVELATQRLLPDQIVLCGPSSHVVPYIDPGVMLARHVRDVIAASGSRPVWLLENHGLFCIAPSHQLSLDMTLMTVKCARILVATAGTSRRTLPPDEVRRIHTRTDEIHRRTLLGFD